MSRIDEERLIDLRYERRETNCFRFTPYFGIIGNSALTIDTFFNTVSSKHCNKESVISNVSIDESILKAVETLSNFSFKVNFERSKYLEFCNEFISTCFLAGMGTSEFGKEICSSCLVHSSVWRRTFF
jgi:hypothetical protein